MSDLRDRREAIVREHMESENRHEFDATIDTFQHPRYEIIPTGDVYDGEEEVRATSPTTRAAFPDQRNEILALHHIDDGVIVEFILLGTHEGELRGMPPTGKAFQLPDGRPVPVRADADHIVCERVYFDSGDDPRAAHGLAACVSRSSEPGPRGWPPCAR